MQGTASVKVPDGKLVRASITYDETVEDVTITGDFFLEPPEAREELEEALEGLEAEVPREEVLERLEHVDARLIGFSRENVADTVMEVIQ
ncbi:MAG: lipoate protein ligase C-terminal domain-containing protein [Candidatus Nanohaloarchaea archaeon]|nr:lipoate protein ligase C-terminal domain-containing protein [Candidatus Nanohaloarchaea archaeon]